MVTMKRFLAGASVLCVAASAVQAAPEPGSNEGLDEVVVTAQKRSESEQSVPMSMTTFGGAAIEQKAITNFFDYATKVPNLAFAPTGDGVGTARTVSIRGSSTSIISRCCGARRAPYTARVPWAARSASSRGSRT